MDTFSISERRDIDIPNRWKSGEGDSLRLYSMMGSSSRDIWASMFFCSKAVLFHWAKAFQATSYAFPALQKSHPRALDWFKARSSSRI